MSICFPVQTKTAMDTDYVPP